MRTVVLHAKGRKGRACIYLQLCEREGADDQRRAESLRSPSMVTVETYTVVYQPLAEY